MIHREALRSALAAPLPGVVAHRRVAPRFRRSDNRSPPPNVRRGAVLIALVPTADDLLFPMIERTDDGGPHARQIALPGGAAEPGDRWIVDTALREAREEIALLPGVFYVLGRLSDLYVDVSNFLISPVVAWYRGDDPRRDVWDILAPDPHEVSRVVCGRVSDLSETLRERTVDVRGMELAAPSYLIDNAVVWGATAAILSEFHAVIGAAGDDPPTGGTHRSPGNT